MPQLNDLRKDLKFNGELLSLVDTLKNVAGAQYHTLEKQKERFDEFMLAFREFFRVVNMVEVINPLVKVSSDILGIVVVTSDSGFMGGLNQGVIRAGLAVQGDIPDDKVSYVIIGEKGGAAFRDKRKKFKFFRGISQDTIFEQATEIRDYIVKEVLEGRMGKVIVAYPKPLSFTAQTIETVNILPCQALYEEKEKEGEAQPDAKSTASSKFIKASRSVIVESSYDDMVEYLASVWVTSELYIVFEDSKLAEFSARATHLEGSIQKVQKEHKKLKHLCFKATHEKIDKGMRESYSAKMIKEKKNKRKKVKDKGDAIIAAEAAVVAAASAA